MIDKNGRPEYDLGRIVLEISRKNMKTKQIAARTIGLTIMSALAAIFVQVHGVMQANWLQYGLKLSLTYLPFPTVFFYEYSFLGYILPAASLFAFFFKNTPQDKASMRADAFLWLIAILSLAWLLASILAWHLPLYYPVAEIG